MKVISTIISASLLIGSVAGILGGKPVSPEGAFKYRRLQEKKYVAGIREDNILYSEYNFNFCGGVIISKCHVLTTASCTKDKNVNFVSVGGIFISEGKVKDGDQIKVVDYTNHWNFNNETLSHNFAVLTLANTTDIKPVKLPLSDDSEIRTGKWATAMGWGLTSPPPNGWASDMLLKLDQQLITNDQCRTALDSTRIDMTHVCAGGVEGESPCEGDTGGPLIYENSKGDGDDVLIGLISGGIGCGVEGSPAVYSRVSSVLEWIESFTNQECAQSA